MLNAARNAGVPASRIGVVGGSQLVIRVDGDQRVAGCTIDLEVTSVQERWALQRYHGRWVGTRAETSWQRITSHCFRSIPRRVCGFGIYGHKSRQSRLPRSLRAPTSRAGSLRHCLQRWGNNFMSRRAGPCGRYLLATGVSSSPRCHGYRTQPLFHSGRRWSQEQQPLSVNFAFGNLAVAHTGNLINATMLRSELEAYGAIFQSTSDTEVIIHLIAHSRADTLLDR